MTKNFLILIEIGIKEEVLGSVCSPNRDKFNTRELYAILHVIFAETEVMVLLHK